PRCAAPSGASMPTSSFFPPVPVRFFPDVMGDSAAQLNILPGIGVPGADESREYVLPFRCPDPGADCVHEGVAKYRDEIVGLQDLSLNLLRQVLALGGVVGCKGLAELGVEGLHARGVGRQQAAPLESRVVPIGPACPD